MPNLYTFRTYFEATPEVTEGEVQSSPDFETACEFLHDAIVDYLDEVDGEDDPDLTSAELRRLRRLREEDLQRVQQAPWLFPREVVVRDVGGMTYAVEVVEHEHGHTHGEVAPRVAYCLTCPGPVADCPAAAVEVRCPTGATLPDGTEHTIMGCGSTNVTEDAMEPGVFDCDDCGISFVPAREVQA